MKRVTYSIEKSENGYTVQIFKGKKQVVNQEFEHRITCLSSVNSYVILNKIVEAVNISK